MHKVTEGGIRRNFGVSDFSKWLYNVGEKYFIKISELYKLLAKRIMRFC